jgi:hypothetical protein
MKEGLEEIKNNKRYFIPIYGIFIMVKNDYDIQTATYMFSYMFWQLAWAFGIMWGLTELLYITH